MGGRKKRNRSLDRGTPSTGAPLAAGFGQRLYDRLDGWLSKKTAIAFWLIYLLAPLSTDWLDYQPLPNEVFDPAHHTIVSSHMRDAWPQGLGEYQVPDAWRDDVTSVTYTVDSFSEHRKAEARRVAWNWFVYGIVGCLFFASRRPRPVSGGTNFLAPLASAVAIDACIALLVFWLTR